MPCSVYMDSLRSPRMVIVPAIVPRILRPFFPFLVSVTGNTSATGFPNRVTRTGFPVTLTCSNTARQVALNFEIAISSMVKLDHSHLTMVQTRFALLLCTLCLTACIDGPPKAGQPTMAELAARQPYQPQPLPPKAQAAEDAERAALAARPLAELLSSPDEADRFLGLPEAIRQAYAANQLDAAEAHSRELIKMIDHFPGHPRYGDAIFLAHQTLGKIALRRNDTKTAVAELIASTNTPGSDRLTHGPIPMDLARQLVDLGERKAVAHFLDRCSHFNLEKDKLVDWGILIRKGINPDLVPY